MDLNNYFKTLAEEHVLIQHSEETPAFFREYASARILLDTDFHKNLRNCSDNILISQFNDDGTLPSPNIDFKRQQLTGTLYIASRIQESDIEAARLVARSIRDDIYARFERDIREETIMKGYVVRAISPFTIGRFADNFYCMALNISYEEKYAPTYNQNVWAPNIS